MEFLNDILPIIIYVLLIVLIIVLIVLAIKLIKTLNKVDKIVDNVDKKVKALDGVFEIVELTSNKLSSIGERVIGFLSNTVEKIFKRKKNEDIEEDE